MKQLTHTQTETCILNYSLVVEVSTSNVVTVTQTRSQKELKN